MSNFFLTDQVFLIRKPQNSHRSSFFPSRNEEIMDNAYQQENNEFEELKQLMKNTFSIIESLRAENSMVRFENKEIKQSLLQYIRIITEENQELRQEIKDINVKFEKKTEEIIGKIEEKIQSFVKNSQDFFQKELKKEKNLKKSLEFRKVQESLKENAIEKQKDLENEKFELKSLEKFEKPEILLQNEEIEKIEVLNKNNGKYEEIEENKEKEQNHNEHVLVYKTKTGKKYHRESCRYLRYSREEEKLKSAVIRCGLGPCSICCPPKLF